MSKLLTRKNVVDINVYLLGILLDSLGVFIIIQAGLGASPFGALTSNMVLILPITIGVASIIYDVVNIIIASILLKEKMQIQNLLYGFIFAVSLEIWFLLMPTFGDINVLASILIFILGVCISDLSKAILNLTKFPKLTSVVTTYAISKRFKINLNWASKIRNLIMIIIAFVFALFTGDPLNNLGIGTLATFIAFGYFLKFIDPVVKATYNRLAKQ